MRLLSSGNADIGMLTTGVDLAMLGVPSNVEYVRRCVC